MKTATAALILPIKSSPKYQDMGRVIGRRGRVARAIRSVARAAGDEEGLDVQVEFLD